MKKKANLFAFIKLLLGFVILYLLYRLKVLDPTPVLSLDWNFQKLIWLGIGMGAMVAAFIFLGLRVYLLLKKYNYQITYFETLIMVVFGAFLTTFTPGMIGCDAFKLTYLCGTKEDKKTQAAVLIFADRVIGFYAMLALSMVAICFLWFQPQTEISNLLHLPVLVFIGATVGILMLRSRLFQPLFGALPGGIGAFFRNGLEFLRLVLRDNVDFVKLTLISMAIHSCVVVTIMSAGVLIGDVLTPFQHFVLDPFLLTLNAVPLTPNGMGVSEGGFGYFYKIFGSNNGALIGLISRFFQVFVCGIGGVVSLWVLKWENPKAGFLSLIGKS
jgi:uncharacterized membrane protein YbhN (UPF0104 family)